MTLQCDAKRASRMRDSPGGLNPSAPITFSGDSDGMTMEGYGAMTASLSKRPGKSWTIDHVRPPAQVGQRSLRGVCGCKQVVPRTVLDD